MPRTYITTPPEVRFWRHVDKDGPLPPFHPELGNCWLWVGSLDPQGYGHFWDGSRSADGRPIYGLIYAHRFAYGETPKGIEVSHLCEVENCVRRSHLTETTHKQNVRYGNGRVAKIAAATTCLRGHLMNESNTYIRKNGTRQCLACVSVRKQLRSP